jgi:ferric-dicitrate binding protein FerR (iron transport regulator)
MSDPANRHIIEACVHHYLSLHSEEVTEREIEACKAWRAESAEHERIWAQMQSVNSMFDGLPKHGKIALKRFYQQRERYQQRRWLAVKIVIAVVSGLAILLTALK